MVRKVLLVVSLIVIIALVLSCTYGLVHLVNYLFGVGSTQQLASSYKTTDYALTYNNIEMKLTVSDYNAFDGYLKDDEGTVNLRVVYENFSTQDDDHTAKIYKSDTNECIDYVTIECDGDTLTLSNKTKNLDSFDPPDILDTIHSEESIFARLHAQTIVLKAVE